MVKRKKIGLCPAEDEKHQDEGMTLSTLPENEKPTENAQESQSNNVCQQINTVRNRIHVTRTATKETQGPPELNTSTENLGTEKIAKALTVQRSSNRVTKRPHKDGSPVVTTLKKAALKQNTPADGLKTRRPWELWSVEDKNAFFEALCEYGKDFENIQSYIAQRSKKKGVPANMIKNKDQVRHFYYRTWHKISKYLEIGEDVRKQAQELYGLINYAELRKKIGGCLNEKNSQRLNELVFNGVTTVKYKGKKLRIKTPVCRALKKLNNVSETKEPVVEKFLKEITVEFRPRTNEAWLHVQNLAQNPRVRTKLCLQRRLKSVIEYLEKRWKPQRLKKKEQVVSGLPSSSLPPAASDPAPVLRVRPKSGSSVSSLTIAAVDNASSSDVCLQKYMKRFVRDGGNSEFLKGKKGRLKPKPPNTACLPSEKTPENNVAETELQPNLEPCVNKSTEELPLESVAKEDKNSVDETFSVGILTPPKSVPEQDDPCENPVNEAERSLSLLKSMLYPVEDKSGEVLSEQMVEVCATSQDTEGGSASAPECKTIEEMYLNSQQDTENLTLGQLLGMGAEKQLPSPEPDVEQIEPSSANSDCNKDLITDPKSCDSGDIVDQHKAECPVTSFEEVITKGWSVEDAGLLTIGELYLMLGKPTKIMLEYEWEYPKRPEKSICTSSGELNSAKGISADCPQNKLSEVLGRLLQIASTTFGEFKSKQQTPLSPTSRGSGNLRTNSSASPHTKSTSRGAPKHSATKASLKTKCGSSSSNNSEKNSKDSTSITSKIVVDGKTAVLESSATPSEIDSTTVATTHSSDNLVPPQSEKNVFVVPVGAAPRTVKQPTQESLREEIDKLLPGTRRGCRVRRKPLVVQRTLLPREGMSAVSRPMTVVHLVPSGSQLSSLAAVIPSNCPSAESKIALPSTKKVVKILSAGPALDVRPLQVPIINAVSADANRNVLLQPTSLSAPHLVMTPASSKTVHVLDNQDLSSSLPPSISTASVATINVSGDRPILMQPSVSPQSTVIVSSSPSQSSIVTSLTLSSLNNTTTNQPMHVISGSKTSTSNVPTISIPYTSCTSASAVSPTSVSSLMEMSLSEGLPTEPMSELAGEQLLDFGENSNLSVSFGLPPVKPAQSSSSISTSLTIDPATPCKTTTSPQISPGRNFRISSPGPEAQWMNGESVEVSLNTLLNTLETPCKVLPASCTVSSSADNSNLDPIVRLAPVVDSQVRCLLDECSVDFIAKFEDLADVINSPATESKQT